MFLQRETANVIQVGVGFFFMFLAFNPEAFIQESVVSSASERGKISKHAGYYALGTMYLSFTFANLFAAPFVEIVGSKWSMVLVSLSYPLYYAGYLYLNKYFLYASSSLLGLSASILWTAQGSYLAKNCTDKTALRNASILWAIQQASLAGGGVLLYVVFSLHHSEHAFSAKVVKTLFTSFVIVSLFGSAILALVETDPSMTPPERSNKDLLLSTLRLLRTKRFLLFIPVFVYTGVELSFYMGVYPTCISFTKNLSPNTSLVLALNLVTVGFGETLAGLGFGFLGSNRIRWSVVIIIGAAVHFLTFAGILINFPIDAPLQKTVGATVIKPSTAVALLCGFGLGFGDACFHTIIASVLVTAYKKQSAQAFAIYMFFMSGSCCIAYFYSGFLPLPYLLLILASLLVVAVLCFVFIERDIRRCRDSLEEECVQPVTPRMSFYGSTAEIHRKTCTNIVQIITVPALVRKTSRTGEEYIRK